MYRYFYIIALVLAILAFVTIVAGQLGFLRGKAPNDLGLKEGKLKRISKTENCVSSQADLWPDHPMRSYAKIEPFKITGNGSAEMAKIAALLQAMPRTTIMMQDANYIYAQSSTPLLKFTDDVEFALDATQGVIHVRSASRLGRKDFGVNRQRIEAIRTALGQSS
jgi:uncharacterized protein (DUF1499 family)